MFQKRMRNQKNGVHFAICRRRGERKAKWLKDSKFKGMWGFLGGFGGSESGSKGGVERLKRGRAWQWISEDICMQ